MSNHLLYTWNYNIINMRLRTNHTLKREEKKMLSLYILKRLLLKENENTFEGWGEASFCTSPRLPTTRKHSSAHQQLRPREEACVPGAQLKGKLRFWLRGTEHGRLSMPGVPKWLSLEIYRAHRAFMPESGSLLSEKVPQIHLWQILILCRTRAAPLKFASHLFVNRIWNILTWFVFQLY